MFLTARATAAEPTVTLVTVGPGDAVWEKFGHNMLRIEDPGRGLDVCFNWGLFDFDQPNFIPNFIRGRMLYTMAPMATAKELSLYQEQDRRVTFQRLRLSPVQTTDLIRRCVDNFRTNPDYRYDYFKDNCSTRVRDTLDATLGGELAKASQGVPTTPTATWRREMLRLMHDEFWLSVGMDFALGPNGDKPLDRWALGFLPATVAEMAAPFAEASIEPWRSTRPPPPTSPRTTWPWLVAGGVIGAAMVVVFNQAAASSRLARFLATAVVYFWWFVAGTSGAFLIYMWAATDHTATYANQNLWHFSPLAWLALLSHLFRQRTAVVWFTRAMVGMAIVGCVVWVVGKVLGGPLAQPNGGFILLSLPLNLAAAWATRTAVGPSTLTKPQAADEVSA